MMLNQGDTTLLQSITPPEAQSQTLSGSAGLACGKNEGKGGALQPPGHCTGNGPPSFQGKTALLSPPSLDRELCDENVNESDRFASIVSNDRTGSNYTKQKESNYMVNMKCLYPWKL